MKLDAWQCDMCKKVFTELDGTMNSKNPGTVDLIFEEVSQLVCKERFYFRDLCINCRTDLLLAIKNVLEK